MVPQRLDKTSTPSSGLLISSVDCLGGRSAVVGDLTRRTVSGSWYIKLGSRLPSKILRPTFISIADIVYSKMSSLTPSFAGENFTDDLSKWVAMQFGIPGAERDATYSNPSSSLPLLYYTTPTSIKTAMAQHHTNTDGIATILRGLDPKNKNNCSRNIRSERGDHFVVRGRMHRGHR